MISGIRRVHTGGPRGAPVHYDQSDVDVNDSSPTGKPSLGDGLHSEEAQHAGVPSQVPAAASTMNGSELNIPISCGAKVNSTMANGTMHMAHIAWQQGR
jgi:hypothetical protein